MSTTTTTTTTTTALSPPIMSSTGLPPPTEGWSDHRYACPAIPSYVPPEVFVLEHGQVMEAFLMRSTIHDLTRFTENEAEESYFSAAAAASVVPEYHGGSGNRTNTLPQLLAKRKIVAMQSLQTIGTRHRAVLNEAIAASGGLTLNHNRELVKRYHFKPHQMPLIGCLFGARGETQKRLVRETGCLRIEFAGRGITNKQKKFNIDQTKRLGAEPAADSDEPHANLVAAAESSINLAIEKIEWWLSDCDEAIEAREDIHRRVAIADGTYDPRTYKRRYPLPSSKLQQMQREEDGVDDNNNGGVAGGKRARDGGDGGDDGVMDNDLAEFLNED